MRLFLAAAFICLCFSEENEVIEQNGISFLSFLHGNRTSMFETETMEFYCKKEDRPQRFKRYAIEGSFWDVKTLTYRIVRPAKTLTMGQLKNVFKRAFEVWEEQTQLKFVYKETGEVNIEILFTTGAHGDGEPFDGRGKILAHAYFPRYGGDLHFDDDEVWSVDKNGPGLDLYAVAVHEAGHSLGLKHSHEPAAIMAPYYQSYTGKRLHLHQVAFSQQNAQHKTIFSSFVVGAMQFGFDPTLLHQPEFRGACADDLDALDRLYGPRGAANKVSYPFRAVFSSSSPNLCKNPQLDAINRMPNGSIHAFQGDYFWELLPEGPGAPRLIKDHWGVEGPFDDVVTNSDGNTYIFKKAEYWLFNVHGDVMHGYPKRIKKGLVDTPDHLDAALIWHHDDKPYFFKKEKYWKYSRWGMPRTWPRNIKTVFKHKTPLKVDTGLKLDDNSTFIFSGSKYWKVDGFRYMRASPGYPKSVSDFWFNCNGAGYSEK